MKRKTIFVTLLGLLAMLGVLAACGGGGGGDDGGGEDEAIPASYDGETTQAVITAENAVAIISNAWGLLDTGRDLGEVVPMAESSAEPAGETPVPSGTAGQITQQEVTSGQPKISATATDSGVLDGDCGGSVNYSIVTNDTTGAFSSQFTFFDYCTLIDAETIFLDGSLSASGQVDLDSETLTLFHLTFDELSFGEGSDTYAYTFTEGSSTYAFPLDMSGETDTLDLVLRDNSEFPRKTYWLNNYVITISYDYYGVFVDKVTFRGRFYDYDEGYVDISTPILNPLRVPDTVLPTTGVLLFTGAANSQAKLTFNEDGSTVLAVDGNRDGDFDDLEDVSFVNPL